MIEYEPPRQRPDGEPVTFDKQLTDLAFRLAGEDRFLVLEAASKLRRFRETAAKAVAELGLI
jgi:broad specificity phosphatase PhoE